MKIEEMRAAWCDNSSESCHLNGIVYAKIEASHAALLSATRGLMDSLRSPLGRTPEEQAARNERHIAAVELVRIAIENAEKIE